MYAIIQTGGKQYRVTKGQVVKVESLVQTIGEQVDLEKILVVGEGKAIKIGQPYVDGAKVSAKIVAQGRHKKIETIKLKRRKHHMKRMGHRQNFTEIEITDIAA